MSLFLDMARVIDQELIAGRINVSVAKRRLAVNKIIAEAIELDEQQASLPQSRWRYSSDDVERDKALDAPFCRW